MKKEEYIKRWGEAAYKKMLQENRERHALHREEYNATTKEYDRHHREEHKTADKKWRDANPEKRKASDREWSCKDGKHYNQKVKYMKTGLQGERNRVREKHNREYHTIKQATPNSVLHDEWIPGTAKYRGLALVEKVPHQNGIIKVIKVLEGEITIFTEKEIAEQEVQKRK